MIKFQIYSARNEMTFSQLATLDASVAATTTQAALYLDRPDKQYMSHNNYNSRSSMRKSDTNNEYIMAEIPPKVWNKNFGNLEISSEFSTSFAEISSIISGEAHAKKPWSLRLLTVASLTIKSVEFAEKVAENLRLVSSGKSSFSFT